MLVDSMVPVAPSVESPPMKRLVLLLTAAASLSFAVMHAAAQAPASTPTLATPGPGGALPPVGITGFDPAGAGAELAREAALVSVLRPDTLRRHLRILTEEPHVAGTPADRATADYVRQRLAAYGWDAQIVEIPVWINYPKVSRLELVAPVHEPLAVRETGVMWDKDAFAGTVFDAFHGYSASGDVSAQVVYANYGDVEDFNKLLALGIDVRGRIVLVRYGRVFRGLKVRNAERAGAAGVLIYSDPEDDGYVEADPYPRGQGRPADAIQRGSVQFLSEGPGDPGTPGWPSTAGGKRLKHEDMKTVPSIPSMPIAYAEAQKILARLEGPRVPSDSWQGGLPLAYHVGPGPAQVHLESEQDWAVRPIWNVIATIKGREQPEQLVIAGNHRDAWNHGAIDPNSGTIAMLEMARGIGTLVQSGWRPRRTLMLCSWDGEEYGLLGSTEWAEANDAMLTKNAVAYLNVDVAVSGDNLRVNGSHALEALFTEAMRDTREPLQNRSVWNAIVDRAWSDGKNSWSQENRARRQRGEPVRPFAWGISSLGSGSDYTVFLDHLGVPSADLRFEGLQGTYHSMYDDFEFLDRVVDPGYHHHMAMAELWSRCLLRLGEAPSLPLRYSATAEFAVEQLRALADKADDVSAGQPDSLRLAAPVTPALESAERMLKASLAAERAADAAVAAGRLTGDPAGYNAVVLRAERLLLGSGLPGRPWFRHELYAPGLNTGYSPVALPRLGQAVLDGDAKGWASGVKPLADVLDRARAEFEKVK
jgi:N-acetylated-alpha-linked acidic dipeptidase